ncbi:MFS transporter [Patescibacteria group bacterium]|nr:MFS transporter [Patescibacteria group bacterium]
MKSTRQSSLFFIYVTVFINIVAFSMVFPLLPMYAKTFEASNISIGLLAASFALAQLLFSPLWGMLSDKYGRKPIMAVGLLGTAVSFLLFGLAASLPMLFVSRFLQGVFSSASIPAARAYIADITSKEERVKEMGRIGASLALGIVLGPAIGGLLAQTNPSLPFLGAGFVALLSFLFVLKFVPESLSVKSQKRLVLKQGFVAPISKIKWGLQSSLMPLFILSLVWSFALSNNSVAVPLLGIEKFNASAIDIGLFFTILGIVAAIVQFFLLPKITSFLGEHLTVTIGLLLMAIGFTIMPFVPVQLLFLYIAGAVAGFGSAVSRPVITALISKETEEAQGVTMGTANTFESLGRLIGPLLGGFLFSYSMATPFVFSGAVVVFIVLFIVGNTQFLKQTKPV